MPELLGSVLEEAMAGFRVRANPELDRIWEEWDGAVGPVVAENARPAVIREGILQVRVTGAPWCQELSYMKAEIIGNLNARLGSRLVVDIRFKVGLPE